jgi:hypothetical protein
MLAIKARTTATPGPSAVSRSPRTLRPAAPRAWFKLATRAAKPSPLEAEADEAARRVAEATPGANAISSVTPAQPSTAADFSADAVSTLGVGAPLPPQARSDFEGGFGADFSSVRVHTDAAAAEAARSTGAHAFTYGEHIAFGAGQFDLTSAGGRSLLAHELTHVMQQDYGARGATLQRKEKDQEPSAPAPPTQDPFEAAQKEALEAVAAIETNWSIIGPSAAAFSDLKPLVAQGDAVVGLLRAHTTAAFDAIRNKDRDLAAAYKFALETDKVTYDYIAWHVAVYVNLLTMQPDINSIVAAFDADDREFPGRAEAEQLVRGLKTVIDGVPEHAATAAGFVRTDVPMVVRRGTAAELSILVTSPAIEESVRILLEQQTEAMVQLNGNVQAGVGVVNLFLDAARQKGLEQAADAVRQFYELRRPRGRGPAPTKPGPKPGSKPGSKPEKKAEREPKPQPEPDRPVGPRPPPLPGDPKGPQPLAVMRFQVQWNSRAKDPKKKGQFSRVESAPWRIGVTATAAEAKLRSVHAIVTPSSARKASEGAMEAQATWIRSRPPAGIANARGSWSKYFDYIYPDARVDVENVIGHNLKLP